MAIEDEDHHHQQKRTKASKHSESVVPCDVIDEILWRLPVKSLLRFMSVCKSWRSLISDSRFVKSHLNLSTANNNLLHANHRLIFSNGPITNLMSCSVYDVLSGNLINELELDYPLKRLNRSVRIVGSCNGLLCLVIDFDNKLFIWNPCTKKSHYLPHSGFKGRFRNAVYGFGYDESTDDYKVVAMSFYCLTYGKCDSKVKIYSLKSGKWKRIRGGFPHGFECDVSGMLLNGSLHWASESVNFGSWTIVSFDLAKETFGQVLLPVLHEGYERLEFGTLGECLCLVSTHSGNHDVWVMKAYGVKDSWTKLVSIPYTIDIQMYDFCLPLFMTNDGRVLFRSGINLVMYDIKTSSLSQIQNSNKRFTQFTFVESLVSPAGPGDNN